MVIAAILHDAVEDHGGAPRLADIRQNFGAEVARMVEGLSDTLVENPEDKEPWIERKKSYVTRLAGEPADVQLISAADKLYNARTMVEDYRVVGTEIWKRFKRGRDEQLWYFDALLRVFRASGTNQIVDELERATNELKNLSASEAANST